MIEAVEGTTLYVLSFKSTNSCAKMLSRTSTSSLVFTLIAKLNDEFKKPISPPVAARVSVPPDAASLILEVPLPSPTVKSPSIVILPVAVSSASARKNCSASKPSTVSASNPLPEPSSAVVIIRPKSVPAEMSLNQSFVSSHCKDELALSPRSTSHPAFSVGTPDVKFELSVSKLSAMKTCSVLT